MSNYPNKDLASLSSRFKALGHPHRLQIFWRLAGCCTVAPTCAPAESMGRCVGDLAGELSIAPSTVSHHIKELTQAGLIATERCGREIRCWVDPAVLSELSDFFAEFIATPSGVGVGGGCVDERATD
jgi:ArsR family transcriptional regulator